MIGDFGRTSDLSIDKTSGYFKRFGDAVTLKSLSIGLLKLLPVQFLGRVVRKLAFK